MYEIGGFFEFELPLKRKSYHEGALDLNSGRNALRYILLARKPQKIWIPHYICNSILEPVNDLEIECEFYHIDSNFKPNLQFEPKNNELMLFVNYFGLNSAHIELLSRSFSNIIVDNSQSFFSHPLKGVDTIYSPRKFFGVADGGYLYTNNLLNLKLQQDTSYYKYDFLLKRHDINAKESYQKFIRNESSFSRSPLKEMSNITKKVLQSIDYERCRTIRNNNFSYLHSHLKDFNELLINIDQVDSPMVYPLLVSNEMLKSKLIDNNIYVATYWQDVLDRVSEDSVEYRFVKYLTPLPIDQRYTQNEMDKIIQLVKANL